MYYRVAIQRQGDQLDRPPSWQWKSTVLSSLQTLFQFLRLYGALPQDQLRVFSSSSQKGLEEELAQENRGHESDSVTAAQFLRERESGAGGDHDVPYTFVLPLSMPQVLAWARLLARVERGEVQP